MQTTKSNNAITHGAYAQEILLPWEDAERFAVLHRELRAELNPNGPTEDAIVAEIADLYWRKRRLAVGAQIDIHRLGIPDGLVDAAKGGPKGIADHMAQPKRGSGTVRMGAVEALDYVKSKMRGEAPPLPAPTPQPTDPAANDVVARAYDPATMLTRLRAESMIDTRIAKLTARLAMNKEYKKLYAAAMPVAADAPPLAIERPRRKWGEE